MLRVDEPVAERERPAKDARNAELLESPDAADDVEDRVHTADLVQVHPFHSGSVDRRFALGDQREGLHRLRLDRVGRGGRLDDRLDVLEVTPVRLRRDREVDLVAGDLPARDLGHLRGDAL